MPNRTRLARMRTSVYQGLSSCGVLFFDVNHLKAVNDTQGHGRGDALLKLVSDSIRSITDERVHGYRYGAATSSSSWRATATRRSWQSSSSAGRSTWASWPKTHDVVATAAVGSCWSKAPFTLNNLIKRADEAMYAEKRRVREHADGQGGLTAGERYFFPEGIQIEGAGVVEALRRVAAYLAQQGHVLGAFPTPSHTVRMPRMLRP
ncbi:MAG TPA: diguanylate cyclase [Eggerthellaceae bacterium]|nr:diguanylate cyclase [Eggerthellaceae bacterium]